MTLAGVLNRDPIVTGSAAAMVNGAVQSFVRAAAIEIAPQRINAVSPTVFTESVAEATGTTVVPKAHSRGPRGGGRPAS